MFTSDFELLQSHSCGNQQFYQGAKENSDDSWYNNHESGRCNPLCFKCIKPYKKAETKAGPYLLCTVHTRVGDNRSGLTGCHFRNTDVHFKEHLTVQQKRTADTGCFYFAGKSVPESSDLFVNFFKNFILYNFFFFFGVCTLFV